MAKGLSKEEIDSLLKSSHELIQKKDYKSALPLLEIILDDNPNNSAALNFQGYVALQLHQDTVAYQYLKRAVQEAPNRAQVWTNFGLAAQHLDQFEEAYLSCKNAIRLDPTYHMAYTNASSVLIATSQWEEAQSHAEKALAVNPSDWRAKCNLAHSLLAKHEWKEGWKYWELSLGTEQRKEWAYGDEKRWDGRKGEAVVIYGEQGLGDEIFYASCVPDAIAECKKVFIDCDPKLEGLFRRSFPKARVYGTRRDSSPHWLEEARIDARCSVGSLPGFYRPTDDSFPGKPYLTADPDRVLMWKALWKAKGKKVIGITSEGGAKYTNKRGRKIPVEAFESLFEQDAIFVSLDYRDGIKHPKLKEFTSTVRSQDYDDTAALIASLDAVVGVNTTAIHCANGLGVPTHILVPDYHQWRYSGEYVWSKTATLYRQNKRDWADVVKEVKL